jgi:orotate phosphoribosyltransferase
MADLSRLLEDSGAILKGHFRLSSGRHSATYFEKFRILEQPRVLSVLCAELAFKFSRNSVDLVAGPATGGMIIAFEVARQLDRRALYVETEEGKKTIRRGATIPPGSRVLVVDDVLTTGLSLRETADAVSAAGGDVVGMGVLIDRSEKPLDFGAPLVSSYRVEAESYGEGEIPDWLAAIPITKPGTRAFAP